MTSIAAARDIRLNPGDIWFGEGAVRLHTLLGSCISVTFWHPLRRLGGMCHFMLPGRSPSRVSEPSGKYADEAFDFFDREMARARTRPDDYEAKVFGGGNMFSGSGSLHLADVGQRNIEIAQEMLARRGIEMAVLHVGGSGHRRLVFDVGSGDAWLSFQCLQPSAGVE